MLLAQILHSLPLIIPHLLNFLTTFLRRGFCILYRYIYSPPEVEQVQMTASETSRNKIHSLSFGDFLEVLTKEGSTTRNDYNENT